jgi:hypothetical protein
LHVAAAAGLARMKVVLAAVRTEIASKVKVRFMTLPV